MELGFDIEKVGRCSIHLQMVEGVREVAFKLYGCSGS